MRQPKRTTDGGVILTDGPQIIDEPRLTDEQIGQLASRLVVYANANIYKVSKSMFGIEASEDDFDRLEALPQGDGVFKCEECGQWWGINHRSDDNTGMCLFCDTGD